MPFGRYFVFMSGVLVGLLFLADWYMPRPAAETNRAEVNKSIIRIHTLHRWPEAIAFDTSLPTIVPPHMMASETPASRPPRDALALLPQPAPAAARAVEVKAAVTKKRLRLARISSRRIAAYREPTSADLFAAGW